jgi:hypothetical protein
MHLADLYKGKWVEQEEILFRVTANVATPLSKNSPSPNDGLFAAKEPLTKADAACFGGHQWMLVVKRYYQLSGASVIFSPEDVVEFVAV